MTDKEKAKIFEYLVVSFASREYATKFMELLDENTMSAILNSLPTVRTENSNFNFETNLENILCDTSSTPFDGILPSSPNNGDQYSFSVSGNNTFTLNGNGKTINGDNTIDFYDQESVHLVYFGTEWRVI
jgi:hypothetical protein